MLSQLLLPILRERFPDRNLIEGKPPGPCAVFPGLHPGIRSVSIYDDGDELRLSVDDLMHGHFGDSTEELTDAEREQRIVERVVEFLEALFADRVVVWGQHHMGGWYWPEFSDSGRDAIIQCFGGTDSEDQVREFVWSGPYMPRHAEPGAAADDGA